MTEARTSCNNNKRKADEIHDDDDDDDGGTDPDGEELEFPFQAVQAIADILNDHITTSTENSQRMAAEIGDLQTANRALTEEVDGLKRIVADYALGAIGQQTHMDEDVSDIEESITDDAGGDRWEQMFRLLREHRCTYGTCKVSKNENARLYNWCRTQRDRFSNRKPPQLSNECIIKLEGLGFHWGNKYGAAPSWEQMYQELEAYKERTGDCNVPINTTNPTSLAKWVGYQRHEFKRFKHGRNSLLTTNQIQKLREIGFSWKGPVFKRCGVRK